MSVAFFHAYITACQALEFSELISFSCLNGLEISVRIDFQLPYRELIADYSARRVILKREGDNADNMLSDYADPTSTNYSEMIEEIRRELNFTSLRYHRLDDMLDSIGISPCKLCTYCWNGKE